MLQCEASRNAPGRHRTRVDESILLQPDTRVRVRVRARVRVRVRTRVRVRVRVRARAGRVHFTTT